MQHNSEKFHYLPVKVDTLQDLRLFPNVEAIAKADIQGVDAKKILTYTPKLRFIGDQYRYANSSIRKIWIPDGVKQLDEKAFENCLALTEVVIPSSVSAIKSRCFAGCNSLQRLVVKAPLEFMSDDAFCSCEELREIITYDGGFFRLNDERKRRLEDGECPLPEFGHSSGVLWKIRCKDRVGGLPPTSNVYVEFKLQGRGETLRVHPYAFAWVKSDIFHVPETVRELPWFAFGNADIKEIILPHGLTSFGDGCFCGSEVTRMVVPRDVKELSPFSFACCERLRSIELPISVTGFGGEESAFESDSSLDELRVDMCGRACFLPGRIPDNIQRILNGLGEGVLCVLPDYDAFAHINNRDIFKQFGARILGYDDTVGGPRRFRYDPHPNDSGRLVIRFRTSEDPTECIRSLMRELRSIVGLCKKSGVPQSLADLCKESGVQQSLADLCKKSVYRNRCLISLLNSNSTMIVKKAPQGT